MAALDEKVVQALNVMQTWSWQYIDPDGNASPSEKTLDEVVNRLAMTGLESPQSAVLSLLCRNAISARASFLWRKYHWGQYYYLEGSNELILPDRWQRLANAIADETRAMTNWESPFPSGTLEKLGYSEDDSYSWKPSENCFWTAICPPETETNAREYFEEWFSAWDISVCPVVNETGDVRDKDPPSSIANKGGRPPVADWEAAALELAGRYYRGDLKPKTIADLSGELAGWLAGQDVHPSDSSIRLHAKAIFDAFRSWERD